MRPLNTENGAYVCERGVENKKGGGGVEKTRARAYITVMSRAVIVQWFKGETGRLELCAGISGYILSACSLAPTSDQITP